MSGIDCHYGDHRFERNGYCRDCGAFNGGLLQFARFEAAEKAGTLIWHGDPENENDAGCHYHFTAKAAARCPAAVAEQATDEGER